jgi:hypothetical protein
MKCPDCGSEGPFLIAATCWAVVGDDGVEQAEDYDWEASASIICKQCHNKDKPRTVRQFYVKK